MADQNALAAKGKAKKGSRRPDLQALHKMQDEGSTINTAHTVRGEGEGGCSRGRAFPCPSTVAACAPGRTALL